MRLTPKELHVDEIKNFVDKFNDKGNDPYFRSKVIDKLWEYEEAEEQGLIVKLPCKVGDKLYYLREQYKEINGDVYSIECAVIDKISIAKYGTALYGQQKKGSIDFMCYVDDIGKTIFLTKAEALQALKERE